MVAAGIVLSILVWLVARKRLEALAVLLDALGIPVPRLAAQVGSTITEIGDVAGRLYTSGDDPAVVLVPGAAPGGVNDTRVKAVAGALARAGRTVFIPELDLYQQKFTQADLDRIVAAVDALSLSSGREVTLAGFSYGGSFALVAAADPRTKGQISRVATLGAYFDLEGVVEAITTGGSEVHGRFIPWDGHPMAKAVLTSRTVELLPADQHQPLLGAVEGEADPDALTADARALYELITNGDAARIGQLVRQLPPPLRSLIEDYSPSRVADRIDVPVLAVHSTDDPLVPHAELLRLKAGLPGAATLTVASFRHVDFDPRTPAGWPSVVSDLWKVWSFTAWILHG